MEHAEPTGRRLSAAAGDGTDDATALQHMGHQQELKRNFSLISMLGLAFAILNTWTALAASITLALPSGGASSVIWGLIVAGVCNLCLAASMAEFLSAYPTAGGQYHWAAIISWPRWSRGISYTTGWINVSGWVALTATGGLLGSTFILNIITLLHPTYNPQPWHQFLIYIAFTLVALLINAFFTRLLPLFTKAAFFWSLSGFVIISITVLACKSPDYKSGQFVYGQFKNDVGWPNGLAWLLGLLQGAFALTGMPDLTRPAPSSLSIPCPLLSAPRCVITHEYGVVAAWREVSAAHMSATRRGQRGRDRMGRQGIGTRDTFASGVDCGGVGHDVGG